MYPSFLTIFFYAVEVLTKFLEHPYTSVLNSASDRLLISISFKSFFQSFDLFFHLGHVSLSLHFGSLPVLFCFFFYVLGRPL